MDPRISILTFPQEFDGNRLHLNILVVPRLSNLWNGDPLLPVIQNFPNLGDTTAAFADADLRFQVRALDGLSRFPVNTPVDFNAPLPEANGALVEARKLFQSLIAPAPGRFKLSILAPRLAGPCQQGTPIMKYLPRSYRESFLFTGSRTLGAVTDDSYQCAIKAKKELNPAFVPSSDDVSWGEIYAFCLRHPQLARHLGLIRSASFKVDGGLFAKGGFVYVDLAADSEYASQVVADFDFLKRYAARIPALEKNKRRQVFAAVLFPVLNSIPGPPVVPGNYDEVFIEAADYDDGYAKIVHAVQPVSQNLLAEDPDGFSPLTDIGIRLGWDDEQILIWQSRQLQADPTAPKIAGQPQRLDAPMGVFGYRIDARKHPETEWHSLVRVRSKTDIKIDTVSLGKVTEELPVEVHPQQLDGYQDTSQFWLPSYFSQWNGKSLVLPDEDAAVLYKTEQDKNKKANLGRLYDPLGLAQIPLRYGETYDFRIRLMDPTGGGPKGPDVSPLIPPIPASAPAITTISFRRHVVPEPVRIEGLPVDNELFAGNSLKVNRPLLGYPAVVFTGKYIDPIPLLKAASDAAVGKSSFGIPDPDVTRVQIEVEVKTLRMDNLLSLSGRDPYIAFYTTDRKFPVAFDQPSVIPLEFRDAQVLKFEDPADLGDLGLTQAELDALPQIVLPTARDVRLTIRAVADDGAAYFAPNTNVGKPVQIKVRHESSDETNLVASKRIRGVYLQPDPPPAWDGTLNSLIFQRTTGSSPAMIERLAHEIAVDHRGMTLVAKTGERVVFGCSRRIRHSLAPDHSSLTFAAKEDLINHWIVAITFDLGRDWTWSNLQPVSFEFFRKKHFRSDAETDDNGGKPVGDWELTPTATIQALQDPQRGHTTLIFLDAVEPKSELMLAGSATETRCPDIIELDYDVQPHFASPPVHSDDPASFKLHLDLPVTTPPAQVPRIVSAGLALSKYERSKDYASTEARRRFLWLEMEEPIRDPNDEYFIRFLGYAPDPLLSDDRIETFTPQEEPPLPIDPELIRVIPQNATDDEAGLSAMVRLEPAGNSKVHFLVRLPHGLNPDSPELFGFFTYELRVGHAHIWSTAHGRWGRSLRTTGAQHPAPTLFCTCKRAQDDLIIEAPYAMAVLNGKNITHDPPRTEIWALLYAQVHQADGKDFRNILLGDRKLNVVPRFRGKLDRPFGPTLVGFQNFDAPAQAETRWSHREILNALRELGLPLDASLSVLCVEMMPTLGALVVPAAAGVATVNSDLSTNVLGERSGSGRGTAAGFQSEDFAQPLTDALGNFRILRTSPLTSVPGVCCADCK
ncbi:MAG: hypothetical protein LAO56_10750 [Acidobacteriia bacterium]|nr:hypothetical protein [Terriglobia bacterium]